MLQLFLLSAVWGVSFLMIRIADFAFPPVWVGLLRCMTGALLLWSVLLFGRHKLPPRHLIPWLLLVAFTNSALPFSFFAWGERVVPSSTAAVLNSTSPIWTLLLALAVTRARTSFNTVLGVILGFTGVALVVHGQGSGKSVDGEPGHVFWGVVVILIAALGYAIATVVAKNKLRGLDPIGLATTQLSFAALMLTPVAILGPHPARIHLPSVLAVFVLGVAGSGIAYLLYYKLLAAISATQVAAVTYLLPIWGIFWGSVAHEAIAPLEYVGVAVVVVGLVLLNRPAAPKTMPAQVCAS